MIEYSCKTCDHCEVLDDDSLFVMVCKHDYTKYSSFDCECCVDHTKLDEIIAEQECEEKDQIKTDLSYKFNCPHCRGVIGVYSLH